MAAKGTLRELTMEYGLACHPPERARVAGIADPVSSILTSGDSTRQQGGDCETVHDPISQQ